MEEYNKNLTYISKTDKHYFFNTLAGLVKALEGTYTVVDLRNECCATGKIVKVHGRMNVEMEDVVYYDSMGNEHVFPSIFLSERSIRYVHMPKNTSTISLIRTQINNLKFSHRSEKTRTFKMVRAKRYQKEITQSAFSKE